MYKRFFVIFIIIENLVKVVILEIFVIKVKGWLGGNENCRKFFVYVFEK